MAYRTGILGPRVNQQTGKGRDWARWMHGFGERVRRMREFLNLSQEGLARRAGLSQTSVSRLEAGRALQTPLLVALRIHAALADELRAIEPDLLTDDSRQWLDMQERLAPIGEATARVLNDSTLETLIRLYRTLGQAERQVLLAVLEALAKRNSSDALPQSSASMAR